MAIPHLSSLQSRIGVGEGAAPEGSVTSADTAGTIPDLSIFDQGDWDEARCRLSLIDPLLQEAPCPRSVACGIAHAGGVSVTTLYRWARTYRISGLLSSLLPAHPQWRQREKSPHHIRRGNSQTSDR